MGLRFFENLLMPYNYVIASHDRWRSNMSFLDYKMRYV